MKLGNWTIGKAESAPSVAASASGGQVSFVQTKAHTSAEGAKNGYIFLVAAIAPFVLAIILALGVGYFFAV